jgi:lipopolysaccharide/colanic/teichoic acid biosynthesis glycosyltransferase
MKSVIRLFDIVFSFTGLVIVSPILSIFCFLIWRQDGHSPFYIASRVGKNGKLFRMVKLRSMVVNADKSGVDSTGANDSRISEIGHIIRLYKLDEISQLWNVLKGDMSLVGPRPNVERDVAQYTDVEMALLSVRPGITDISSVVFSDEGEILKYSDDPDLDYSQLIRPWKSRFGLFYIENSSFSLNIKLIILTIVSILSKEKALQGIQRTLEKLGANEQLVRIANRTGPLIKYPPPGSNKIVDYS